MQYAFTANNAVEQKVIVATVTIVSYVYTLLMYTNTHSIEAE